MTKKKKRIIVVGKRDFIRNIMLETFKKGYCESYAAEKTVEIVDSLDDLYLSKEIENCDDD